MGKDLRIRMYRTKATILPVHVLTESMGGWVCQQGGERRPVSHWVIWVRWVHLSPPCKHTPNLPQPCWPSVLFIILRSRSRQLRQITLTIENLLPFVSFLVICSCTLPCSICQPATHSALSPLQSQPSYTLSYPTFPLPSSLLLLNQPFPHAPPPPLINLDRKQGYAGPVILLWQLKKQNHSIAASPVGFLHYYYFFILYCKELNKS